MKIYSSYEENHVIMPGRDNELQKFLNQDYNGLIHKRKNSLSSNSEDALTWSCFDIISQLPTTLKIEALNRILDHSFDSNSLSFDFCNENEIQIFIGKKYSGKTLNEETEVDASIETGSKVIFIEAKLYSSISLADKNKSHDQIARKLRVGLDFSLSVNKEFYFIFLDIAPPEKLNTFSDETKSKENAEKLPSKKWKSAWWFKRYKKGANGSLRPLREALKGLDLSIQPIEKISNNMGWLTWSDLYKIVLKGIIQMLP